MAYIEWNGIAPMKRTVPFFMSCGGKSDKGMQISADLKKPEVVTRKEKVPISMNTFIPTIPTIPAFYIFITYSFPYRQYHPYQHFTYYIYIPLIPTIPIKNTFKWKRYIERKYNGIDKIAV